MRVIFLTILILFSKYSFSFSENYNFQKSSKIEETVIFKDKIGRIRDIQVHPVAGKIYFLVGNSLWLMEKKK